MRLETASTEWDPVNLVLLQRVYVVLGFGIVHKRCRIGSVEVFLNVGVSITDPCLLMHWKRREDQTRTAFPIRLAYHHHRYQEVQADS